MTVEFVVVVFFCNISFEDRPEDNNGAMVTKEKTNGLKIFRRLLV